MKKAVSIFLCAVMLLPLFSLSFSAFATEKEVFDDGSYITVGYGYINDDDIHIEGSDDSTESATGISGIIKRIVAMFRKLFLILSGKSEVKEITKTKYARYCDMNGTVLWTVYLTAKFSYDGKKSECVSVEYSHTVKDSDWKMISADCTKENNTAKGSFTLQQYKLGVKLKTIEKVLTLVCDEKGNVK